MKKIALMSLGLVLAAAGLTFAAPPAAPGNLSQDDAVHRNAAVNAYGDYKIEDGHRAAAHTAAMNELFEMWNAISFGQSVGYPGSYPDPGDYMTNVNDADGQFGIAHSNAGDALMAVGDAHGPDTTERQGYYDQATNQAYAAAKESSVSDKNTLVAIKNQVTLEIVTFEDDVTYWLATGMLR